MKYEIVIKGHLNHHTASLFDGVEVSSLKDGTTLFSGGIVDQSALLGILRKINNMGMELISVKRV